MTGRAVAIALALVAVTLPATGQGYRVRLDSRIQGVSWRGVDEDSLPVGQVVEQPDGGYLTPDGYEARCTPGFSFCRYYRAGAVLHGVPWVTTADASLWGFGVSGLSARFNARLAQDLGDNFAFAGTEPSLQLFEGYLEYARSAITARAGRQFLTGRLGAYGLDGGRVLFRHAATGLEAGAYLGWGLARGTGLPVTDAALNPLNDFQPRDRQVVAGAELGWQSRRADIHAEYRREVDPSVHYFVSERAAVALTLRPIARIRFNGGALYDMAFGQLGNADASLSWIGPRVSVTGGVRQYRPFFDLWTIWGAFSPAAYHAWHGSVDVTPIAGLMLHVRGEHYQYDNTETSTPLVDVEDHGWRYETSATWLLDRRWTVSGGYQAEFGPGASSLGYNGRLRFAPSEVLSFAVHGARVRRPLELRWSDARLTSLGAEASIRPDNNWRFDLGATRYREDRDRPDAAAVNWDQWRLTARMSLLFGSGGADRLPLPRAVPRGTGG